MWLWRSERPPAKSLFRFTRSTQFHTDDGHGPPCLSIRQLEHPDLGTLQFLCSFARSTPTIGPYNPLRTNDSVLAMSSRIMRARRLFSPLRNFLRKLEVISQKQKSESQKVKKSNSPPSRTKCEKVGAPRPLALWPHASPDNDVRNLVRWLRRT